MRDAVAPSRRIGATEHAPIAAVAHLVGQHPDLTSADLSAVLQQAQAAAERRALRAH